MLEKIRRYVEKWHMIEKGDKIVVGVSGGADSICLLFVLLKLQRELSFELICVHVNHGLRGDDADADEAYVKSICEKYQIPCVIYREDVAWIAKKRKQSLEEAGREVRREAFERTCKQCGGTKIALAHHKNDNAETFFMNVARGTGLRGLGGMHPVKGNIIRPLLAVEREEIEQYLKEQQIAFCTDQTNETDDYTRNRIRNHIVPYFEQEINPKVVAHIGETMEQLREVQLFLEEQTECGYRACTSKENQGILIKKELFCTLPRVIQPFVLKRVLFEICHKEKDLEAIHLEILKELLTKQVGKKVNLPYSMEAVRTYEGIICQKKEEKQSGEGEKILVCEAGKQHVCRWNGWEIRTRVFEAAKAAKEPLEKIYTKWFDYDIITSTVTVRTRRTGDYLTIHADGRRQKLKSYFINEKIPASERETIPLIAQEGHILWVVGYRTSSICRVTEHTKRILEIQINEGEESWQKKSKY